MCQEVEEWDLYWICQNWRQFSGGKAPQPCWWPQKSHRIEDKVKGTIFNKTAELLADKKYKVTLLIVKKYRAQLLTEIFPFFQTIPFGILASSTI